MLIHGRRIEKTLLSSRRILYEWVGSSNVDVLSVGVGQEEECKDEGK